MYSSDKHFGLAVIIKRWGDIIYVHFVKCSFTIPYIMLEFVTVGT
jgi:hypothetical protein